MMMFLFQFVQNDEPVLLRTFPLPVERHETVDDQYVDIVRSGNLLTANIKNLYIRITARFHRYRQYVYINYNIFVPRLLCESSFGHLGNCGDNTNNDRSEPNDRK